MSEEGTLESVRQARPMRNRRARRSTWSTGAYVLNADSLATMAFLASFFFYEISYSNVPQFPTLTQHFERLVFIALLPIMALQIQRHTVRKGTFSKISALLYLILLIQIPYILVFHLDPLAGTVWGYIGTFITVFSAIAFTALYAGFFYRENLLISYFFAFARLASVIAILGVLLNRVVGSQWLLNIQDDGGVRPQAFFSEPSAFAPVLTAGLLIAGYRRSYTWMGVLFLSFLLVLSPTAIITLVGSLVIYAVLFTDFSPASKVLVASVTTLVLVFVSSVLFVLSPGILLDPENLLSSDNRFVHTIGRVFSGIQFLLTGGREGSNDRGTNAIEVITFLQDHGLMWTGYGLGSSSAYFSSIPGKVQENSLILFMLFSYGVVGAVLMLVAMVAVLPRLARTRSGFHFLYVPFMVAAMINSAQGLSFYKFVFLGVFVYLFGIRLRNPEGGKMQSTNKGPLDYESH